MNSKKNIIISVPIVWTIRNIFYSGLIDKLQHKYNIYYVVPNTGRDLLIEKLGIDPGYIIVHPGIKNNFQLSILNQALQRKFNNKYPANNQCFNTFRPQKKTAAVFLRRSIALLLALPGKKRIHLLINRLTKKQIGLTHFEEIRKIKPEFIFSTAHVTDMEKYYFPHYANLGYRIYAFIFSFDNLVSRGYIAIEHFNKILVWNKKMKEEAVKYYNVSSEKIFITGSPQFELNKHASPARARLKFDLEEGEKIICYCANHFSHTPTEPELVKQIIEKANATENLQNYRWIIRLHPLDNFKRWDDFKNSMPGAIINEPWVKTTNEYFWDIPSREDFLLLGDLLAISSLVLNMASTTTLDALSLDKPVITIGFSTITAAENTYYYECHFTEHFDALSNSGAFDLVTGIDELLLKMNENLMHPEKKRHQRQHLIDELTGSVKDPVERIAAVISN